MPVGSILSITHLTDHWHRAAMPDVVCAYAEHGLHIRPRSREEISVLFGDLVQQEPGLTATVKWHSQGQYVGHPEEYCAASPGSPSNRPHRPAADRDRLRHHGPARRRPSDPQRTPTERSAGAGSLVQRRPAVRGHRRTASRRTGRLPAPMLRGMNRRSGSGCGFAESRREHHSWQMTCWRHGSRDASPEPVCCVLTPSHRSVSHAARTSRRTPRV
ncbi:SAM-dependent methyltransferase [Streptomyces sp. NPDC101062]|uniref:SAM-dependent methyltransferase n=1 Tax=unclassified Streptomyces TaxID=2593676 RepID=UPI00380B05AC